MRFLAAILASATLLSAQTAPYVPKQSDRPEVLTVDEPGFQPIFDGKTLSGWEGNPTYWRAENGVLVGEITAQEALANVAKHARATEVDIALELTDRDVVVAVQDNGVGAASKDLTRPRSHGLAGLRHRIQMLGGRFDMKSPSLWTTTRAMSS